MTQLVRRYLKKNIWITEKYFWIFFVKCCFLVKTNRGVFGFPKLSLWENEIFGGDLIAPLQGPILFYKAFLVDLFERSGNRAAPCAAAGFALPSGHAYRRGGYRRTAYGGASRHSMSRKSAGWGVTSLALQWD